MKYHLPLFSKTYGTKRIYLQELQATTKSNLRYGILIKHSSQTLNHLLIIETIYRPKIIKHRNLRLNPPDTFLNSSFTVNNHCQIQGPIEFTR